ncbi:putative cytochrome p450 protein [Botrytis fragariae]|uniref:Putative cytochrome p450 protein n=1 Tax=Botrytis fragariae TaxID=1964551 RepID=A0A8H6EG93_9HELO|nr:putative cytochrome p450 protein [Botrytis fragariae]KAF5871214.1 putative cytochrome p450 protein [Botrytis fragariae]
MAWEATNWKSMYKLPDFMGQDMISARSEFIDTLCKYFETPRKDRSDSLYFVTTMEEEIRAAGLSDRETAGIQMLHLWAITANVCNVAFWAIAHIVHSPELLGHIRAEVAQSIGTDGETVDLKYPTEDCPQLEAFFKEVLRINSAGALAREWEGNCERHKSLTRSQNFRPFGGGHTLCPGRFIAKKSVYTIVALPFSQYDVTLDTDNANQKFSRIDEATAGIGKMAPMPGEDVKLVIKPVRN